MDNKLHQRRFNKLVTWNDKGRFRLAEPKGAKKLLNHPSRDLTWYKDMGFSPIIKPFRVGKNCGFPRCDHITKEPAHRPGYWGGLGQPMSYASCLNKNSFEESNGICATTRKAMDNFVKHGKNGANYFVLQKKGIEGLIIPENYTKFSKGLLSDENSLQAYFPLFTSQNRLIKWRNTRELNRKPPETANKHKDAPSKFDQHCSHLISAGLKFKITGDTNLVDDECEKEEQDRTAKEGLVSDSAMIKTRNKDKESLLSSLFQEKFARENRFALVLPLQLFPSWFLQHSVGDVAVCDIPSDLVHRKTWIGLELYVQFKQRPSFWHDDMKVEDSSILILDFYAHGATDTKPVLTYPLAIDGLYGSNFVFCHVPRTCFQGFLDQCRSITALIRGANSDLEVQMCGTRLLYENNSKDFIREITESVSDIKDGFDLLQRQAETYVNAKTGQRSMVERKIPQSGLFSPFERKLNRSCRELMTSIKQATEDASTTLNTCRFYIEQEQRNEEFFQNVLLHSKLPDSVSGSVQVAARRDTRSDFANPKFYLLQIMTETAFNERTNLVRWRRNVKFFLDEYAKRRFLIVLSAKGRVISVFKHFDPLCTYNLCFPCTEIHAWFETRSSTCMVQMSPPANLSSDESWTGLAICAAYEFEESPSALSDDPFKLLCHFSAEGNCLNPISMFSMTKQELITMSHLGGFIWLTYMPRVFLSELNDGLSWITAIFYQNFNGVKVKSCGMRLLYKQDVGKLRGLLTQHVTSFLDDLNPILKFAEKYENEDLVSC